MRLGPWGVVVALVLAVSPLAAQNNDELNAGVEFNFSNPGARSLGMAGAFNAVADDATAAYVNPAGLMILAKPEVAGEFRRFSFAIPYVDRGHAFGAPTGKGLDVVGGLQSEARREQANALSFLSFTYPSNRWAFAVYRHQMARFRTTVNSTAIFITGEDGTVSRFFPTQGELAIDVVNYGLTGAFKVSDNLLIGAGLSYDLGMLDGVQRRYSRGIPGNGGTGAGEEFGTPLYSASNLVNYTIEKGNSTSTVANVGLLFKPSDRWTFGAVYRRGPSFKVDAGRYFVRADRTSTLFASASTPFHVPDVFGAGMAVRPFGPFVMALDVDHVRYSSLVRDFGDVQNPAGAPDPQSLKYVVDDGVEVRLGGEYLIRGRLPVALRLGVWRDPDHRIRYDPGPITIGQQQVFASIAFQRGKDRIHAAGGAGVVFSNAGQLDLGVDVSQETRTVSLSFVKRFTD